MAIRVALVEDHQLVRAGIRSLLEAASGIEVVGEAGDGREALEMLESVRPDVVILDVTMPGLNGLETATRVRKAQPDIRILMLSMYANEEYVAQAMRAGARGYIFKDSAATDLESAIRTVARGERYFADAPRTFVGVD